MFGGLEAALVFLLLVMPGLLLIGGYYGGLGRPQALSASPVHTLAQAVAWSVALLALPIVLTDVEAWVLDDKVQEHVSELLAIGYATIFVPFGVGALMGWRARRWPRFARVVGTGTGWGFVAIGRGDATKREGLVHGRLAPHRGRPLYE